MSARTTLPINLLENKKFKTFIDAFTSVSKAGENLSLDENRRLCSEFFLPEDTVYEPIYHIENIEIHGRDLNIIPLRIYTPNESKSLPTLIYFHRGGWVFGSMEEADPVCRKLANHLQCIVVSVDYLLAPENPFPKPLNDCYDATLWVYENRGKFGNQQKIIVCGESAGGNLAAAVALLARDQKQFFLDAQVLIYPVISSTLHEPSYKSSVDQYFLTKESMTFFWQMYLPSQDDYMSPYASPNLASNLSKLPPAVIITGEYDPLEKEALDYADQLKTAGVTALSKSFPEGIHGFIDLPIYDESLKVSWIKEIGKLLKQVIE